MRRGAGGLEEAKRMNYRNDEVMAVGDMAMDKIAVLQSMRDKTPPGKERDRIHETIGELKAMVAIAEQRKLVGVKAS